MDPRPNPLCTVNLSLDLRQPPAIDRLVVVTDEEDAVGGRREEYRESELRPVHVLDLVDEQLLAVSTPTGEQGRVAFQLRDRAQDQVVEIESSGRRDDGLIVHECLGHRARFGIGRDLGGGHAQLHLEPRDDHVEAEQQRRVGRGCDLAQDGSPIGQRLDRHARIAQDLAAQGVERADADGTRGDAQRRDRSVEPLRHLDRCPLVERDRPDRIRRRAGRDQPGGPRDQRRRLAAPRRGDAQRRTGRRGRRCPLVRGESREPFGHGRVQVHGRSLAGPAHPTIIRR